MCSEFLRGRREGGREGGRGGRGGEGRRGEGRGEREGRGGEKTFEALDPAVQLQILRRGGLKRMKAETKETAARKSRKFGPESFEVSLYHQV